MGRWHLKKQVINHFIDAHTNMDLLIPSQLQQTWSRILFGTAGLFYIWAHGDFLAQYDTLFTSSVAIYFIYNILTLHAIKQSPLSAYRMLFSPLLDVWVVSLAMMVDGGQTSGLYLVFFIIIFGNAVRFGNAMLLYSQALSILGIISVSLITLFGLHLQLDGTLLFMQSVALIVVPTYVLQIKKQANIAMQAKQDAEDATFGLLDHGPLPAFTFHLDDEGIPRILYANLAMQYIYRDSTIGLIGEQVDILALMEDGDEIIKACQHVFSRDENPEPFRFYIRGRDASDHILQLMGQSMCLHWHDQWIGVCFLLDITQGEVARNELEQSIHNSYINTLV
ncbi:MAG: hybrid sensor histidine kinase/response regulator, partial [Mariprofundaceae bacterium]